MIDTVIIPVVSYVTTIEKQIQAEYPDVKIVINILDLIHPGGERQQIALRKQRLLCPFARY